ncbi:AIPR family protein [Mycobacterium sp. NPDC003323]
MQEFGRHLVSGRTESRAFLGWFLENYYRLDETEAQDAICDGPDDKGIDGIYVDHTLERIDVFQTKLYQVGAGQDKTLGDSALKHFAGSLDQLATKETAVELARQTGNVELRELITAEGIPALIESGYEVRGFFVTNVAMDDNAKSYLATRGDITVHDVDRLTANWVAPGESTPVSSPTSFQLDGHEVIEYRTPEATVYITTVLASDLITLDGLQSGELFSWNVRQALGKTKVNKAIAISVKQQSEHKNFMLFHNGLTVLAEEVEHDKETFTINGYTVVNGCQSLSTLNEHRSHITDELRILTRVIKIPPQSELAAKITRNSNNQNSISARDLQSNSTLQRRLQTEFHSEFAGVIDYEIKRGETHSAPEVITNEDAARVLLAFDLEQPWSCHQSYRLFDELHSDIFGRPGVNAARIASLIAIQDSISDSLIKLDNQLFAGYRLTQYFLVYLVRQALADDEVGIDFIKDPKALLDKVGIAGIKAAISNVVDDLITDLNAELAERAEEGKIFDYKRELKSATAVRSLKNAIVPNYQKAIRRNRATSFAEEIAQVEAAGTATNQ